jgi:hypothetical protein
VFVTAHFYDYNKEKKVGFVSTYSITMLCSRQLFQLHKNVDVVFTVYNIEFEILLII